MPLHYSTLLSPSCMFSTCGVKLMMGDGLTFPEQISTLLAVSGELGPEQIRREQRQNASSQSADRRNGLELTCEAELICMI